MTLAQGHKAVPHIFFVGFNSLHHNQQFFSHVGTILPGLNQYYAVFFSYDSLHPIQQFYSYVRTGFLGLNH